MSEGGCMPGDRQLQPIRRRCNGRHTLRTFSSDGDAHAPQACISTCAEVEETLFGNTEDMVIQFQYSVHFSFWHSVSFPLQHANAMGQTFAVVLSANPLKVWLFAHLHISKRLWFCLRGHCSMSWFYLRGHCSTPLPSEKSVTRKCWSRESYNKRNADNDTFVWYWCMT